jgi:hypothetical protein
LALSLDAQTSPQLEGLRKLRSVLRELEDMGFAKEEGGGGYDDDDQNNDDQNNDDDDENDDASNSNPIKSYFNALYSTLLHASRTACSTTLKSLDYPLFSN